MKVRAKEGFSLVEMMITVAIMSVLMLTLITVLSYGSRSMRTTQAKVALQDQAKDVVNHISTYVLEGNRSDDAESKVEWIDTAGTNFERALVIRRTNYKYGTATSPLENVDTSKSDVFIYWSKGEYIYFMKLPDQSTSSFTFREDTVLPPVTTDWKKDWKNYVLTDKVDLFDCSFFNEASDNKKGLHVQVKLKDDTSEFDCQKDIIMRNQ